MPGLRGRPVERARLHQLFGAVPYLRTVHRYGCVSVQRFYLYAEQGLSRQRGAIWNLGGITNLTVGSGAARLPRAVAAISAAHEPVPDDIVGPTPRSQIRMSTCVRDPTRANWTLVRLGKAG